MRRISHTIGISIPFLISMTLWGQSFSGRIVGLVTDSSNAVIPNVAVTVVNEGTGAQRRLITDSSGIYISVELPVGYYTVRFEAPGLGRSERRGVKVDVGGETRADVSMSVAVMEQSVEVKA